LSTKYKDIDVDALVNKLTGNLTDGRVLIKRCEMSNVGSIIIPHTSREKEMDYGLVVQISKVNHFPEVKVGCKVYFGKYAGVNLPMNGEVFYLLNEDDILYIEQRS
jgi:chaperonin GroES|tara:strand:+ start:1153 stop:1470 length:318 start_codon:yes stop_codon:yes gene_type:complete